MPAEAGCTLALEGQADPLCLERVHELVDELWAHVPDVEVGDRYRFETAVIEVAGNIVEHGGERVRLRLQLHVRPDRLQAQFCDTGQEVDLAATDAAPVDGLAEDGRGLALARATADAVTYERAGATNRWSVTKYRTAAG